MRPKVLILAAAGLFAAMAAQACPACGDKLSLVGGGVSFERVSQAGPPGRIVVLSEPGSQMKAAETDLGLVAEFKRSGHDVKVVADANELDRVVREQGADIVVAHWSEAAATAGRLGTGTGSPTIVSVSYKSDDASARAGSSPRRSTRCWTSAGKASRPIAPWWLQVEPVEAPIAAGEARVGRARIRRRDGTSTGRGPTCAWVCTSRRWNSRSHWRRSSRT